MYVYCLTFSITLLKMKYRETFDQVLVAGTQFTLLLAQFKRSDKMYITLLFRYRNTGSAKEWSQGEGEQMLWAWTAPARCLEEFSNTVKGHECKWSSVTFLSRVTGAEALRPSWLTVHKKEQQRGQSCIESSGNLRRGPSGVFSWILLQHCCDNTMWGWGKHPTNAIEEQSLKLTQGQEYCMVSVWDGFPRNNFPTTDWQMTIRKFICYKFICYKFLSSILTFRSRPAPNNTKI